MQGSPATGSQHPADRSARTSPEPLTGQARQSVAGEIDWKALNKQLHANGFDPFATEAGNTKYGYQCVAACSHCVETFCRGVTVSMLLFG